MKTKIQSKLQTTQKTQAKALATECIELFAAYFHKL